jgi:Arc/MetJ-type ribon-helix-helix transcriptional regulator
MSTRKERLTVTVDPELIAAGNDAVSEGRAESLSAWVNAALAEKLSRERRLAALADAVAAYEARFGAISMQELDEQRRADRRGAVVVRGNKTSPAKRGSRRRPR